MMSIFDFFKILTRDCCRDSQIAVEKMDPQMCITLTEDFKLVCLHKTILEEALGTWHIQQGENRRMNISIHSLSSVYLMDTWASRPK